MSEWNVVLEIAGYAYVTIEAETAVDAMQMASESWQTYAPDAQDHALKGIGWMSGNRVTLEPV